MSHTKPRTDAGKRLDLAWPGTHLDRLAWREAVVAVEMEAEASVDRFALAARSSPAPTGLREAQQTAATWAARGDHERAWSVLHRGVDSALAPTETSAMVGQSTAAGVPDGHARLLDEDWRLEPTQCPMCGGAGRIYDITAAIEDAQAAGTVLVPLSPTETTDHA